VGRISAICGKKCPRLHCFGTFAGSRAHHQGLRWLKLANSEEMFIGIVNLTNFDQLLNSSYWQFVVHGQEAIKQMSLVSGGFNLQI